MATCALMTKQTIKRLLVLTVALQASSVAAQTVKIVGIGASSCAQFTREIGPNSSTERDYFAWAQGFMSGVLAQAPLGVDEGLDLDPPSLALPAQAAFLREYCSKNQDHSYADAVIALYSLLQHLGRGT